MIKTKQTMNPKGVFIKFYCWGHLNLEGVFIKLSCWNMTGLVEYSIHSLFVIGVDFFIYIWSFVLFKTLV
jgi:hypothetical protein